MFVVGGGESTAAAAVTAMRATASCAWESRSYETIACRLASSPPVWPMRFDHAGGCCAGYDAVDDFVDHFLKFFFRFISFRISFLFKHQKYKIKSILKYFVS